MNRLWFRRRYAIATGELLLAMVAAMVARRGNGVRLAEIVA